MSPVPGAASGCIKHQTKAHEPVKREQGHQAQLLIQQTLSFCLALNTAPIPRCLPISGNSTDSNFSFASFHSLRPGLAGSQQPGLPHQAVPSTGTQLSPSPASSLCSPSTPTNQNQSSNYQMYKCCPQSHIKRPCLFNLKREKERPPVGCPSPWKLEQQPEEGRSSRVKTGGCVEGK